VANTYYSLDGGAEVDGRTPSMTSEGIHTINYYSVDNAGNVENVKTTYVRIDRTAPEISGSRTPAPNIHGWNNSNVTVSFSCSDVYSGLGASACPGPTTFTTDGAGQSVAGTVTDNAGNSTSTSLSGISIDKTAPGLTWNGSIAAGSHFVFGSVPAAPTCSSIDPLSGPDGCAVSGYGTTVGSHTLTALAKDKAGNTTTETRTYTVDAWTLNGFYNPVDMSGVYNIVKGGSTVPLKFNVYAGTTQQTSTSAVASFTQTKIACDGSSPTDEIEVTTTGGTSLRYDGTGGQFIQNWQTPKQAGQCYRVTMTTQDGSTIRAFFKLK